MKKSILSLAIIAALSFSAAAQTENATCSKKCDKDRKECVKKECDKKDTCCKQREMMNPFAGLNLTDQQKEALKQLRQERKDMKECKGDSTCTPEKRIEKARAIRTEYLAKVKAILTPEQYVQYLENQFVNSSMGHGKGMKKHGDMKKAKDMKKGQKRGHGDKKMRGNADGRRSDKGGRL